MTEKIRFERDGKVAVIVIDNPPVNAGSLEVRRGLLAAIERLAEDAELTAGVLIGAGSTFISGSDLREFGKPLEEPQLPAIIDAIENCPKPVVAALHGAALGGGFELALGCDARVADPQTVVGLPEVTLGMIPGAGGTQRLPRIVGVAKAIDWICTGKRVSAGEARTLGVINAIADGDLRAQAVQYALSLGNRKSLLRDRSVEAEDSAVIESAAAAALKAGRNRPPVQAAIASIRSAAVLPIDDALRAERAVFQKFRLGSEALALRYQFFAERSALKLEELEGVRARRVVKVAVIGAGTMGVGIASCFLEAGFQVMLMDQEPEAARRGLERIEEIQSQAVAGGKLAHELAQERLSLLTRCNDFSALADVDLVVEAVFEDMATKQAVFRHLDEILKPGALVCTNTSYLDIDALAAVTKRPENVCGMHFFSPAHVMRLVEVVRGRETSSETLATAVAVANKLKKLPVVAGNAFGFIGNRIFSAYRRQCEFMLEEGAWPEEVDAAMKGFGFAMGPFAVGDLSGLDIAWRMRQALAPTRDRQARYVQIPDRLCEMGRFGQKTGAGYYRYPNGARSGEPDPAVRALIETCSAEKGIERRAFCPDEIQRRALLAMINEAACLLREGVVSRASDVDLVLVNGYGFPKWEGGPVYWARQHPAAQLGTEMNQLAASSGAGFVRGDLSALLAVTD